MWWRYALLAVRKQLRARGRMSWVQLSSVCRLRKEYVPAYARWLVEQQAQAQGQAKGAGAAPGGAQQEALGGDAAIAAMDAQLSEGTILLFRWVRCTHPTGGCGCRPGGRGVRTNGWGAQGVNKMWPLWRVPGGGGGAA